MGGRGGVNGTHVCLVPGQVDRKLTDELDAGMRNMVRKLHLHFTSYALNP